MERTYCIAGNWKMFKTAAESREMITELKNKISDVQGVDVVLCPTFTSLAAAVEAANGSIVEIGAQNVHWAESGAFTGEIAASMLCEIGIKYVIIGHSERRQYFGETDATVNARIKAALAAGLTPIVCVGETLEERESGDTESVVGRQLTEGLAGFTAEEMAEMVLAYEPVWAIGTGLTATPDQAQQVHAFIRQQLRQQGGDVADAIRIQYGGSVKPGNAAELLGQPDIDGALIGGASLNADDFSQIIHSVL